MVLVVLPALIPDIRKLYDVYFSAFKNEKMGQIMLQILFPGSLVDSEDFRAAHAAGTLDYWHKSSVQYTFKCVDSETGEIVGIALGDVYLQPRSEEERKFEGVPWLQGEQRERAEKVLKPLWEVREKLFGGQPYLYVHVIGVEPKHQGRKAGAAVIEWGTDLCERTNLPLYFESSPTTVALYEKWGYQRLREKIVHKAEVLGTEKDIEVPLMVRMPSGAGGIDFYDWKDQGYLPFTGRVPKKLPNGSDSNTSASTAQPESVRSTPEKNGVKPASTAVTQDTNGTKARMTGMTAAVTEVKAINTSGANKASSAWLRWWKRSSMRNAADTALPSQIIRSSDNH